MLCVSDTPISNAHADNDNTSVCPVTVDEDISDIRKPGPSLHGPAHADRYWDCGCFSRSGPAWTHLSQFSDIADLIFSVS